ncbi:hypothetical protein [Nonomuraea ceibae]|uniref:hypothetical protein n=1 Tax=Nonomuraea ceibae TaxID=1935170 RepID=UPI001C5D6583|nr:hypothetical protein [Nonomuraea ceibae]
MSGEQPDLGQIHTRAEFKGALERLRAGRSYAALDKAAEGRLPKSTVSDLLNPDKGLPDETTLEALLRACGVPPHQESAWLKARKRVLGGGDPRTAGLIRVAKAEPRRLGVHAAIDVPGADGELPAYVERDTDTAPRGVRTLIGNAAEGGRGGLVVLVGSSSVGKTRCAFEAIRARVPDWWLLHPSDTAQIRAIAADPPARLVVWLDELQRYLDGVDGLQAGTVRALLAQGAVLVATLWPDRYDIYTALPQPGQQDTHAHERELLSLADVVDIAERFTPDERVRAEQIAADGDVRLAVALHSDDYGLTQTIAAAPQLMRRWRQADAYAAAVLTAAVDATRLGVDSPLPAALLLQAAPGYCDPRQSAKAPSNWFENALAYLTEELHGAASALTPIASPRGGMGQTTGYRVADYLQQHAQAERRHAKIPATCWQALTDHLTDPSEQTQVAGAACDRLLYRYADRLYCNATQTGAPPAGLQWIDLLARRENVEELRLHADAGDWYAAERLARLLAERGEVEELRARADAAGDWNAAGRLAGLLAERGEVEELRARADAGDQHAAFRLARLLAERGEVEELRARADAGDRYAADGLAGLLAERGEVERLRARADAGDQHAAFRLARLLAERGEVEELRARADTGDPHAADRLARLSMEWRERGEVEELRARADTGDQHAAFRLARLLAERGEVEELRARADTGDRYAAGRLIDLLAQRGEVEELRARADTGDRYAADRLAGLLVERGEVEELRARVDAGEPYAANWLIAALVKRGQVEEAERLRRYGLEAE